MGLLNFFKINERPIEFSEAYVEKLSKIADDLGHTLIKAGFGFYVDILTKIRIAAKQHDNETFKKLIISRELFGGAGAMWEIWIEDKQLHTIFEKQFCDFLDLLKKMGIKNGRINQVRQIFPLPRQ